jgi:hypothetical protein
MENKANLLRNYDESKRKHLEKLTSKMLKHDEINNKLKEKQINIDFLKLF